MGFGLLVECSRACHTQFIRHRMASYWAESQRYVDYSRQELRLIVPRDFPLEPLEEGVKAYMLLRSGSQRPEWARLVLPNAVAVRFVVQMNARELFMVFAPLRCSASAQAEIRHLLGDGRNCVEALAHAGKAGLGRYPSREARATRLQLKTPPFRR